MMSAMFLLILSLLALAQAAQAPPPPTPLPATRLQTRWAADVSPDRVWPEYPRPQLERQQWTNLNGTWDYAITAADAPRRVQVVKAEKRLIPRTVVAVGTLAAQARSISIRDLSSLTGRPPGSNVGTAPESTAPRSPARRGTQARRAPVRSANAAAADSAPGAVASRSPTRITEPSRLSSSRNGLSGANSASASSPGRT